MSHRSPDNTSLPAPSPGQIDPRGPVFGAAITSMLLLVAIFLALTGAATTLTAGRSTLAERALDPGFLMLGVVAILFTWSLVAPSSQPLQAIFRLAVQPRLAPPADWEDARPPRFAQGVGLAVVGIGLVLHLAGVPLALVVAAAAAFVAAALNATVGFCLGCEIYLLLVRARVITPKSPGTA
ncbi:MULTISPECIES: DUF4395 domain-containing protein [unclassified Leucobacter]|uniref:DUF4395 domain-containing protein n=1 Tax=unclassified Leucobacter TaxID=2621730 RepID=UPI00165D930A|nr:MULTISPECIES: DUF4395 domain-containing protein [unclassified Leucobacter]MBC9935093.1 DUF4395 domain-containing protein [Leucobacter sp. cx-87]